ncbi:hypothetical protein BP00DRAFT_424256 [Aspergillus indologenus CBS 114.80]|uniref:Uncharacterized protein n=1 Tax=Aspergillus indologenus CBS 114.80 TaxID=1450541 RepID=A0A2V5IDA9_9EURO|nr:hypothetical protein BP00DRAFT_424256 [Aspergillus indologenus CBS 114.80]
MGYLGLSVDIVSFRVDDYCLRCCETDAIDLTRLLRFVSVSGATSDASSFRESIYHDIHD